MADVGEQVQFAVQFVGAERQRRLERDRAVRRRGRGGRRGWSGQDGRGDRVPPSDRGGCQRGEAGAGRGGQAAGPDGAGADTAHPAAELAERRREPRLLARLPYLDREAQVGVDRVSDRVVQGAGHGERLPDRLEASCYLVLAAWHAQDGLGLAAQVSFGVHVSYLQRSGRIARASASAPDTTISSVAVRGSGGTTSSWSISSWSSWLYDETCLRIVCHRPPSSRSHISGMSCIGSRALWPE